MDNEGYKCVYCSNCPYYEFITDGKCGNYDCVHYETDYTREDED